jgi:2-polyprenyl-3-methyl-5-hydroxy-6-metoxy-1,4-benzoquinol methylase
MTEFSPSFLSFVAKRLFVNGSLMMQLRQWYRPFICPFDELITRVPVDSHVLDVGCGGGLFLGLLRVTRRIAFGHGFDSSPQAIAVARQMAARAERSGISAGSLLFEHRRVTGAWPGGQFDVVSIVDVMHHVRPASQQRLLKLAVCRIKPGGLLLYKDMASQPQWRAVANRLHDLLLAHQCIHYVPIAEVKGWATDAGLELIESRTINRLWYSHELCVFRKPQSN